MTNLDVGSQQPESDVPSTSSLGATNPPELRSDNSVVDSISQTSDDTESQSQGSSDGEQGPQGPVTPSQYRVSRLSRGINRAVRQGDHKQATDLMDQQLAEIMRGLNRSEERRVGKECSSRWSPHH